MYYVELLLKDDELDDDENDEYKELKTSALNYIDSVDQMTFSEDDIRGDVFNDDSYEEMIYDDIE